MERVRGSVILPRTTIRQLPARGSYQRETINAILDKGLVCHAGFIAERRPVVIPMAYGRDGDRLFLHGSAASRAMRSLAAGIDLCVTVTLFDGLVLARSLFHHSMNYRSVVIFGEARLLEDRSEKLRALDVITEHIVPGRVAEARTATSYQLPATSYQHGPAAAGLCRLSR
jgi:nitroimidazol reductase NimA-like FMN-containing flavoprotein (pyridoxamine 5'-phosphate oxidase superfamily)